MSRRGADQDLAGGAVAARPRRPVPVLEVVALAVTLAGAATTWSQTYGWRPIGVPILVGVAGPALLALLLTRRPAWLALLIELVLFVPAAIAVLAIGGSTSVLGDLADGLQRGWADVLSTSVPVSGAPALLVVPFALTWLASIAGFEAVARTRRVVAPVLAPVALLAVARAYAPSGASTAVGGTAAVVAGGIVFVAARHARLASRALAAADPGAARDDVDSRRLARRRAIVALPIVVLVTAVAVLAAPKVVPVSDRPAASLRDTRTPERSTNRTRDPLDELNATLADDPETTLFSVTMRPRPDGRTERTLTPAGAGATVAPGLRWTLLTLDTFDGSSWTSSATYRRAGTTLPAGPAVAATTEDLRQTITLAQPAGSALPAVARPVEARSLDGGVPLTVDPTSGTIGADADTVPAGTRYEVASAAPVPSGADLAGAHLPADRSYAPYLALPTLPAGISEVTRQAMASAHTPFEQVAALERYLRGNGFTYDAGALTGHSVGDLARFLGQTKESRKGTAEQFATAFAVMARTRGLPTRLAVGYRPDPGATWQAAGDEVRLDLTRGDTDIWPEVYFDGLGWVAFDPLPSAGAATTPQQLEPEEVAASKSRAADAATAPDAPPPPAAANPIASSRGDDGEGSRSWTRVLLLVAGGLLIAVAVWIALRVRRVLRRRRLRARRRGAGEPGERILGAWHEAVDHLEHIGVGTALPAGESLASATVTEVGDAVARRHGDAAADAVRTLGRIVNGSTFEPEPPTAADADRAWTLEADIHRTLTAKTPVLTPVPVPDLTHPATAPPATPAPADR